MQEQSRHVLQGHRHHGALLRLRISCCVEADADGRGVGEDGGHHGVELLGDVPVVPQQLRPPLLQRLHPMLTTDDDVPSNCGEITMKWNMDREQNSKKWQQDDSEGPIHGSLCMEPFS